MISRLPDHMNAEVVLGNVTSIREAAEWLRYTYLYIRMLANPSMSARGTARGRGEERGGRGLSCLTIRGGARGDESDTAQAATSSYRGLGKRYSRRCEGNRHLAMETHALSPSPPPPPPLHTVHCSYGVTPEMLAEDPELTQRLLDLAHTSAAILDKAGLVKYDRKTGLRVHTLPAVRETERLEKRKLFSP